MPFRWDPEAGARIGVLGPGGRGRRDPSGSATRPLLRLPRHERLRRRTRRWCSTSAATSACSTPARASSPRTSLAYPGALAGRPGRLGRRYHPARRPGGRSSPASTTPWPAVPTATATAWRWPGARTATLRRPGPLRPGRDEAVRWDPGPGRSPGEPVFVRDPDGRSRRRGLGTLVVYDAARGMSDLVILDASAPGGHPRRSSTSRPGCPSVSTVAGCPPPSIAEPPATGSHRARGDRSRSGRAGRARRVLAGPDRGRDRLERSLPRPRATRSGGLSGENDLVEFDVTASAVRPARVETRRELRVDPSQGEPRSGHDRPGWPAPLRLALGHHPSSTGERFTATKRVDSGLGVWLTTRSVGSSPGAGQPT